MENISNEVISIEEARAALRCMRLCNLDEAEALESVESLVHRVRKIGTAKIVEKIIENKLSESQRCFVKEYWYEEKNTAQIAREHGVSQANVYRTVMRAHDVIKELITPLVMYHSDLADIKIQPLFLNEIFEINAASKIKNKNLSRFIKNIRLANAVTSEQMAQAVCITEKELDMLESGKKQPTLSLLKKYCRIFSIEIDLNLSKGKEEYRWREI